MDTLSQDIKPKAAYTVLGIDLNGNTDVLGIWLGETEGAHFWLSVLDDIVQHTFKC